MLLKRRLLISVSTLAFLAITGCSRTDGPSSDKPAKREISIQTVAAEAKGFSVGTLTSVNAVYVFFDPQCPHCGHLWQASIPLHKKAKFVWIPIAWINASSMSQGAALLTASNPLALMGEHETSLLAGKGGIAASSSVAAEVEQSIKANTKLLGSFGAESVPFVVVKNAMTGETISRDGALTTAALATLIGVEAPQ